MSPNQTERPGSAPLPVEAPPTATAPPTTPAPEPQDAPPFDFSAPSPRRPVWRWIALGAALMLLAECLLVGAWWLLNRRPGPSAAVESSEPSVDPLPSEDEFCIRDSDLGAVWLPIQESVARNTYQNERFTEKNGLKYYEDETRRSLVGVDVSEFQGEVDWQALASAGIEYAMIRVGRRGYVSGDLGEDESFAANVQGARDAGLLVGVYFFSQATTPAEAEEEAAFVLERIRDCEIALPVVFDWERQLDSEARTFDMTGEQITACAVAFCDAVKQAGYRPCVYLYKAMAYYYYDMSRLTPYDIWLSEPNEVPEFYYDFAMWQYDVEGTLPGLDETVDLNLCFVPVGSTDPSS